MIQPDMPQIAIWRIRIACWLTKATNTNLEYVILSFLHHNNGLERAPECYKYIVSLINPYPANVENMVSS
jgi:hypothetical protein